MEMYRTGSGFENDETQFLTDDLLIEVMENKHNKIAAEKYFCPPGRPVSAQRARSRPLRRKKNRAGRRRSRLRRRGRIPRGRPTPQGDGPEKSFGKYKKHRAAGSVLREEKDHLRRFSGKAPKWSRKAIREMTPVVSAMETGEPSSIMIPPRRLETV